MKLPKDKCTDENEHAENREGTDRLVADLVEPAIISIGPFSKSRSAPMWDLTLELSGGEAVRLDDWLGVSATAAN